MKGKFITKIGNRDCNFLYIVTILEDNSKFKATALGLRPPERQNFSFKTHI